MPAPFERRLDWRKIGKKQFGAAVRIAGDAALIGIERLRRREIGLFSSMLKMPPERVRERYFQLKERGQIPTSLSSSELSTTLSGLFRGERAG